jgi:hypothetical protein
VVRAPTLDEFQAEFRMLIINADDFGRTTLATDRILACYDRGSLTSTSAMVFMADSQRAGKVSQGSGLDIGLHLNFTEAFTAGACAPALREDHNRIVRFLTRNRYAFLCYHPGLRRAFRQVVGAQLEEFQRIYQTSPSHINGHHHMHLCANMLLSANISRGQKVRRNFSFRRGEKGAVNRVYRGLVDWWLLRRFRVPDFLFPLHACLRPGGLERIVELARGADVELETHPENQVEFDLLMGEKFLAAISGLEKGTYAVLNGA